MTLLPEEEEEQTPPPKSLKQHGYQLVFQIAAVICLKVATGMAIRNLTHTIREMDILYPEHLSKVRWKDHDEAGL